MNQGMFEALLAAQIRSNALLERLVIAVEKLTLPSVVDTPPQGFVEGIGGVIFTGAPSSPTKQPKAKTKTKSKSTTRGVKVV